MMSSGCRSRSTFTACQDQNSPQMKYSQNQISLHSDLWPKIFLKHGVVFNNATGMETSIHPFPSTLPGPGRPGAACLRKAQTASFRESNRPLSDTEALHPSRPRHSRPQSVPMTVGGRILMTLTGQRHLRKGRGAILSPPRLHEILPTKQQNDFNPTRSWQQIYLIGLKDVD